MFFKSSHNTPVTALPDAPASAQDARRQASMALVPLPTLRHRRAACATLAFATSRCIEPVDAGGPTHRSCRQSDRFAWYYGNRIISPTVPACKAALAASRIAACLQRLDV